MSLTLDEWIRIIQRHIEFVDKEFPEIDRQELINRILNKLGLNQINFG